MQKISQSEYQHSQQLTTAKYNTFTVITLINFYDQRVFTPRNNKRRIIRVDMDLQSVSISCQFTSGIWVEIHEAEYTVLEV